MALGEDRRLRFSQPWMPNPLATADIFQLPVFSEHHTPNWTEERKKGIKASISTLHGFKIMSISVPPDDQNL